MATRLFLTDEPSDIAGYRRAVIERRGDAPSLVRAVTSTAAGPSSGVQVTRSAGGTALAWLTDPLAGVALTAAAWSVHVWAKESDAAANAALRVQVLRWQTGEGSTVLDNNAGTELGTTVADAAITTGVATATTLADGDRLVIKLLIDDAGTLAAGYTATVAYGGEQARAEGDSYLTCPDSLRATETLPLTTVERVRLLLRQAQTDPAQPPTTVAPAEIEAALAEALRLYSRARPRALTAALSGDGTSYDFPLPRGWVHGLSRLIEVEYPAGEQVPAVVDANEVAVYQGVLGTQPVRVLRFLATTPASGTDNIVVRYTGRHVHTDEGDSVPADDLDAVCALAGSVVAEAMAAEAAGATDSTMNADSVDRRDGEQRWRSVARALRERYQAHVGATKDQPPAGLTRDWDTTPSWGTDRLFHGRRGR